LLIETDQFVSATLTGSCIFKTSQVWTLLLALFANLPRENWLSYAALLQVTNRNLSLWQYSKPFLSYVECGV